MIRIDFFNGYDQPATRIPLLIRWFLAALVLGIGTISTAAQSIPQPEDAFTVQAINAAPGEVAIKWTAAPDTYLYESAFKVKPRVDTGHFSLLKMEVQPGRVIDDLVCGDINVLDGVASNQLYYDLNSTAAERVTLLLSSQGCHRSGYCYPPQTHEISMPLVPTHDANLRSILANNTNAHEQANFQQVSNDPAPINDSTADNPADKAVAGDDKSSTFLSNLLGNKASTSPTSNSPTDDQPTVTAPTFASDLSDTGSGNEVLSPEQAFQPTVRYENGDIVVDFSVNDCCYLYQDKLQLSSNNAAARFDQTEFPEAITHYDESFGDVWVYKKSFQFATPIYNTSADDQMNVMLHYQGCAKIGICYPPQVFDTILSIPGNATAPETATNPSLIRNYAGDYITRDDATTPLPVIGKPVDLPSVPGPIAGSANNASTGNSGSGIQNAQDAIIEKLTKDRYKAVFWFFLTGLLLAFTPCVFPMIPILSGIIIGQGDNISRLRGFLLSLSYVIGMAVTYTIAGLIAGLLGANLQIAFQNPWALSIFATIFILFALAMFGVFTLQVPGQWQSKLSSITQKLGGSYLSIFFMGALSALIVGPCAAPPLAAVLSVITATGDPMLGGVALFVMGLGMGVPLLIVGLSAGSLLPKAGAWMEGVKNCFGLLMLAVAILLLERLVGGSIALILWGSLAILSAVICGAFEPLVEDASFGKKFFKALGIIFAIIGVLEISGGAMGNRNVYQPLKGLGSNSIVSADGNQVAALDFMTITSPEELDQIIAANPGKPLMIDFYADWCTYCKDFEIYTFSDPAVQKALHGFVLIKADITKNDAGNKALMKRFQIIAPPAILFFDGNGTEQRDYRLIKFTKAKPFADHVNNLSIPE